MSHNRSGCCDWMSMSHSLSLRSIDATYIRVVSDEALLLGGYLFSILLMSFLLVTTHKTQNIYVNQNQSRLNMKVHTFLDDTPGFKCHFLSTIILVSQALISGRSVQHFNQACLVFHRLDIKLQRQRKHVFICVASRNCAKRKPLCVLF